MKQTNEDKGMLPRVYSREVVEGSINLVKDFPFETWEGLAYRMSRGIQTYEVLSRR